MLSFESNSRAMKVWAHEPLTRRQQTPLDSLDMSVYGLFLLNNQSIKLWKHPCLPWRLVPYFWDMLHNWDMYMLSLRVELKTCFHESWTQDLWKHELLAVNKMAMDTITHCVDMSVYGSMAYSYLITNQLSYESTSVYHGHHYPISEVCFIIGICKFFHWESKAKTSCLLNGCSDKVRYGSMSFTMLSLQLN